jgi:phage-related protein
MEPQLKSWLSPARSARQSPHRGAQWVLMLRLSRPSSAASSRRRRWHPRGVAETQAVYYRDVSGVEPVNDFIESLPTKRAAKIDDHVEEHLNGRPPEAPPPAFPVTSQIEGELRELRVRFANTRYRLLYQRSDSLVVLLHAFEKHTGAVSEADKRLAQRRMQDFKARMDAERRMPPRAAGKDAPPPSRRSG